MSDVCNIERNIPLPVRPRRPWSKYPFRDLKVGESFLVPCTRWDSDKAMNSLTSCRANMQRKTGFKFALRKTGNGIRVWRTV